MSERNHLSATEQPDPTHNHLPALWEVVIADTQELFSTTVIPNEPPEALDLLLKDMKDRDAWGRSKYGTPLQPFNGRDSLIDLYQEMLDSAVYLAQHIYERQTEDDFDTSTEEATYQSILTMLRVYRTKLFLRDNK